MAREFVALHDHVLIEPSKVSMTAGGIALPDSAESAEAVQVKTGTVRYAGPGSWLHSGSLIPCEARVGREVEYYILAHRGRKRVIEGKELDLVRDTDVVGYYT